MQLDGQWRVSSDRVTSYGLNVIIVVIVIMRIVVVVVEVVVAAVVCIDILAIRPVLGQLPHAVHLRVQAHPGAQYHDLQCLDLYLSINHPIIIIIIVMITKLMQCDYHVQDHQFQSDAQAVYHNLTITIAISISISISVNIGIKWTRIRNCC